MTRSFAPWFGRDQHGRREASYPNLKEPLSQVANLPKKRRDADRETDPIKLGNFGLSRSVSTGPILRRGVS